MDAIELAAAGGAKAFLPEIAPGDTSGRFRDLIYLVSTEFAQRNATHLPFKTAFRAYAYQLGYRLNGDDELVEEPLKFHWHVADSTQVHFTPHAFLALRQPRPLNKGPLQWSLESIPATEHSERRQDSQWMSDLLH